MAGNCNGSMVTNQHQHRFGNRHHHAVTGGRQFMRGTKSPTKDCDATPSILAQLWGRPRHVGTLRRDMVPVPQRHDPCPSA
jgi:hypothetical protein